jgi:hypothetical protein
MSSTQQAKVAAFGTETQLRYYALTGMEYHAVAYRVVSVV